ncbi:cytochrome b-c1 complex subunit 10-like [Rhynchophorus ferrugineus]|uniref:Cytochrome b-c1 complex subunit 10 n=1 Tax=Rhynchophorus ferrugineus TaxID=354439 RepID=A0A834I114_RHYFE|nr:hypothetical protein GWI33_016320 [Rhynchophorus ferrugineus]
MPGPVVNAARRLPGPLGAIGKKHVEILSQWLGTAGAYGATAGVLVCYLTDWRVVVDYIPFYNGKFSSTE